MHATPSAPGVLRFLKLIDQQIAEGLDLHLIVDNYTTWTPDVETLAPSTPALPPALPRPPRRLGSTWSSASLPRSPETASAAAPAKSVAELKAAIMQYLENHNADPKPFLWTRICEPNPRKSRPSETSVRVTALACFPMGILCAYFRSCGAFHALSSRPFVQATANLSFGVALVIGTYCNRVWPGWLLPSIIASGVLVVSVHVSSPLRRLFATPFSRWLGYISFPLYLSHFPVIASFTSGTVVLAHVYGALGPAMMWLIIAISVALSFVTAMLFLPVEVLTVRIGDFVVRVVGPEDYSGLAAQPLKKRPVGKFWPGLYWPVDDRQRPEWHSSVNA